MTPPPAARAAVLVIDMQNGFCHPKGSSAAHGMPLETAPAAIAGTTQLLAAARAEGLPLVYLRHVYRPGLIDMPARLATIWPRDPDPVVRGSWDAEIVEELTPLDGDHVIDKNRFDAFLYTDLEPLLRSLGAERLLVAGCLTNVCVETSVRAADQRGFECFVAEDCTAAFGEGHAVALGVIGQFFGTVGPWRTLLAAVAGS